jgi:aspartate-semialdehyde dehydrogenase
VEFGGKSLVVRELADFDFSQVQLAFFCVDETVAAEYAPRAAQAGCTVIDSSAAFRHDDAVPLVIPTVNPQALADYPQRHILASPDALTTLLLTALEPLREVAGIERVEVATYQAVSGSGKRGVKELAGQTANLLNARPMETELYGRQIAFNVLARIGALADNGYTREEMNLVDETRRVLGDSELAINPTAVRVPVFYGCGMAVHLQTRDKLTASQAKVLLQQAPGLTVVDEDNAQGYPSPATEAANNDAVLVGRIREDLSHPRGLDLWIVSDNVRQGGALNSVQMAEILVKDHL